MKLGKLKKAISLGLLGFFLTSSLPTQAYNQNKVVAEKSGVEVKGEERKIVGYFPEWAYKSDVHNYFNVTDLQWDTLTHIQYSFGVINDQNKIDFGDKYAAVEEDFKGMDLSFNGQEVKLDESLPYKGHFNLLQVMKKKFPDVKLLLSVGGWAASRGFYTMMDTDAGIDTFVDSAVKFIRDYGFDGVDIDFEFPSSTSQSGNPADFDVSEPRRGTINARYNVMIKKLREGIDKAGKEDGKNYLVTAAVSASSWVLGGVESNEYAKHLDFLSIMSYDFHGGWNEFVENQANIYPDPADRETAGMIMPVLAMDWAYRYYRGVLPPEKILMGIPYYTRGWENVQGGNGTGLHGSSKTPATGNYNIWGDLDENGNEIPAGANPLWHVLNLMEQDPNLKLHWDEVGKVPYVWQNDKKVFLTFENENSIDERLKYIEEKNLGGALIWVMDGDFGPNPNYVPGSTNVNEGKYTVGDTLTSRLSSGLDKMGPAKITNEGTDHLEKIDVDVKLSGTYDHPNYTYTFDIKNNTTETFQGGWELAFDLPKSAVYKSSWGGTATEVDNGDFTRITLKSSGWQSLDPGATATLQGMIGLCFSDVRNITFNGKAVNGEGSENPNPPVNKAPSINGATNKTVYLNEVFDKMAGVTASDVEDGDLTSKITVTGDVDTTKVGNYNLTYKVIDSEGLETVVNRVVSVVEKVVVNNAPVISGVDNKTIKLNEVFDKMAGVTASDIEDGDLTSKITISGEVDSSKVGKYTLTYKVVDSKGLETVLTRTITVVDDSVQPGDNFDINAIYNTGDKVIYKGVEYTAKWWTQGNIPGENEVWERKPEINEDGSIEYVAGTAYVGGDIVRYNGKLYKAKWWTTATPGSDSSWEAL